MGIMRKPQKNYIEFTEKEILCNCIENYIEIANINQNTLRDYFYIISFIKILQKQYKCYSDSFNCYLAKFDEAGILDEYNTSPKNLLDIYYTKYGVNVNKAREIQINNLDGCTSRYLKFMIAIALCGTPSTPQSRMVLADIYSWNFSCFYKQVIYYSKLYLNNKLNIKNKSDSKVHYRLFYEKIAGAYAYSKDFESALLEYNECIKFCNTDDYYIYYKIIDLYKKFKGKEEALNYSKSLRKIKNYILNENFRNKINQRINELEKELCGIKKHEFYGYDCMEGLEAIKRKKYDKLKENYKNAFEQHRQYFEDIDEYSFLIKQQGFNNKELNEKYINACLNDIKLLPTILNFFKELKTLNLNNTYEINDNNKKGYDIFKKIAIFYEKIGNYSEAIKYCDLAINYGFNEDGTKMKMTGRKEKLQKKIK